MSDYIVTTKEVKRITGFEVVDTVEKVTRLNSKSVIVFESSLDTPYKIASHFVNFISQFNVSLISYISDEQDTLLVKFFKSINAHVDMIPEAIEDIEIFNELLKEMHNKSYTKNGFDEELAETIVELDHYLNATLQDKPRIVATRIRDCFNKVTTLASEVLENEELERGILSLVTDALSEQASTRLENKKMKQELANLQSSAVDVSSGVENYQPYSYMGNATVLQIKEHTPVPYLTSFLSAFTSYMNTVKQVKTKFVIIDRKSEWVSTRYSSILEVDYGNLNKESASIGLTQEVYTVTPTNNVMSAIMTSIGVELYVVLDRTGKKANAIVGRNVTNVSAVSTRRIMRALGLTASNTIVADSAESSQLAVIGLIEQYPMDKSTRIDYQQRAFENQMEQLSKKAGY